jgi:Tol biopolymer transport system component
VVFPRVGMQNELSFSNDGRYVIYREGDVSFGEDTDLYYLDTSTGEHRPLLRTPFMERSPRLSPDGTLLAYVTNATGRDEVWGRAFPGPGGEWQISTEGGSEPLWAHDGEELFYRTSLALVSVEVPSPFSPGRQTALFRTDAFRGQAHHTTYDVMPDDDTFAFLKQDAEREVIIVQHFFEELQRKAGNEP